MSAKNNKFPRTTAGWLPVLLLAFGVPLVLFLGLYERPPQWRVAYVYHPPSDQVFALVEKATALEPGRWVYLLPHKSSLFGDFEVVRYLGRLGEWVPGAARAEVSLEAVAADPRHYSAGVVDAYVISDPRYRLRADLDARDLLPKAWAALAVFLADEERPLLAADVAVMTRRDDKLTRFEMLHGALFVRGPAARELWRLGYR